MSSGTKTLVRSMSIMTRYIGAFAETDYRFQTPIPSKDELKQLFQTLTFALKLRSQLAIQTVLGVSVVALIAMSGSMSAATVTPAQGAAKAVAANTVTLDEVSSANIAAAVAVTTDAIVAGEVVELATALDTKVALAAGSDTSILSKPAIVETDEKTADDIIVHEVQEGEALSAIADHYGIKVETIKWANNLSSDRVSAGTKLNIPSVNGVLYTVADGDTPEKLASTYNTSAERIIAFNDAELSGLTVGQKILIPDGVKPKPAAPAPTSTPARSVASGGAAGFAFGNKPAFGGNTYYYGYCTWGVANIIKVPNNWGNARTWDEGARASGYVVSSIPVVGSIAQSDYSPSGAGHVGIVTGVNGDQVKMLDMNGIGGFGRYHEAWYSVGKYRYIYVQ